MADTEIKGIDVSTFQKPVDWQQVKADGVRFAILRAGFGDGNQDVMFESHMKGALDAGLDVGIYWFLYSLSAEEARQEARKCLKLLEPYKGKINYPIYADYEYDSDRYAQEQGVAVTKAFRTDCITAFCDEVEKAGWYAGWYANLDYIRNKVDMTRLKRYDLWLADYTGGPDYDCGMQQYTSSGQVSGITGGMDCNTAFRDYPTRIRDKGCNFLKPESPAGSKPQPETPAIQAVYRVRTTKGSWLPEVTGLKDYAGLPGCAITDVAIKVYFGRVKYRAHVRGSGWLSWITGYDLNDAYGYAGNGKPIDAIQVYYYTPEGIRPYRKAKYRVSPLNGSYWPWQRDTETTDGQDGYAGSFGRQIDRFQLEVE